MSGEPGEDVVLIDFGLAPLGVDREKYGTNESFGSGVLGGCGGLIITAACERLVELIHLSSREPRRGDSGRIRKASAK